MAYVYRAGDGWVTLFQCVERGLEFDSVKV